MAATRPVRTLACFAMCRNLLTSCQRRGLCAVSLFMNTRKIVIAAIGTLALAAPVMADDSSSTTPSAEQQCRTEQAQMGKAVFAQTYGTNHNRSNAFGKCVSKREQATSDAQQQAQTSAA